jgi:hypothetical protein
MQTDTVKISITDANMPEKFRGDYVLRYLTPKDLDAKEFLKLTPEKQYQRIIDKMLISKPKDVPDDITLYPIPVFLQISTKVAEMMGVSEALKKQCLNMLTPKFTV